MLNNNLKSTLTKTAAAAALTLAGAAIVNNTQNTVKAAEVTVGQQEKRLLQLTIFHIRALLFGIHTVLISK